MQVVENFNLANLNTFRINSVARYYVSVNKSEDLTGILSENKFKNLKKLVLGGGSNILFTQNFDGLVIHMQNLGIEILGENEQNIMVSVQSGVNWDEFVKWSVNKGFGGIENLSLIPGSVGASPVQNIGAYGVEAAECIEKVEFIEIESGKKYVLGNTECRFGYRDSIFKNELRNNAIITSVVYKLSLKPLLKLDYGAVKEELNKFPGQNLQSVRQAIINIRSTKLPDPEIIPNAGSFFKNPVVTAQKAHELKEKFPGIVTYPADNEGVKIAAGWLIDFLGWKGKQSGNAAVHNGQALVLVNNGNASGNEILNLAEKIRENVYDVFDLLLEFEVNII
ncbi:MAG: UDP-N-acetylmuramate dehydrogenase [Bacteroidales bacterium]